MRRWLIALVTVLILSGAAIGAAVWFRDHVLPPIRVGILHSETGPMAISEKSMIDAEKLAIEEINERGFLGRQIEWVVADGRSDWPTFAREAQRLIDEEGSERHLRLLDLGQPQERQAGCRAEEPSADLSHGVRGPGAVAQHHLHRCGAQPAGHSRLELVFRETEGAEVLPGRLGLRLASLRERNRQGSAQGSGCRVRR